MYFMLYHIMNEFFIYFLFVEWLFLVMYILYLLCSVVLTLFCFGYGAADRDDLDTSHPPLTLLNEFALGFHSGLCDFVYIS